MHRFPYYSKQEGDFVERSEPRPRHASELIRRWQNSMHSHSWLTGLISPSILKQDEMGKVQVIVPGPVDAVFDKMAEPENLALLMGVDKSDFRILSSEVIEKKNQYLTLDRRTDRTQLPIHKRCRRTFFRWRPTQSRTMIVGMQISDPLAKTILWQAYTACGRILKGRKIFSERGSVAGSAQTMIYEEGSQTCADSRYTWLLLDSIARIGRGPSRAMVNNEQNPFNLANWQVFPSPMYAVPDTSLLNAQLYFSI